MTELNIRFNTGRPYTEDGQIVYATWRQGGMVKFADVSRRCYGRFKPDTDDMIKDQLRRKVISYYNRGDYEICAAAYEYFNESSEKETALRRLFPSK